MKLLRTAQQPAVRVTLARDLRRVIKRGHPWLFRDALGALPAFAEGSVGLIVGKDKRPLALGYLDPEGPLTARILTTDPRDTIDDAWVEARLARALDLRRRLFDGGDTTGYRVVNGEGDGLPCLVVDRYGETLVVKTDGPIAEAFWDAEGIARWFGALPGVSAVHVRARSRGGAEGRTVVGSVPEGGAPFLEGGIRWRADVIAGQKTGFFLDQREPRAFVRQLAAGRRVLNTFAYTGGFSVAAGMGGAARVVTVDIAPAAVAEAARAWGDNGLDPARHAAVTADVFEALADHAARQEVHDLVVLDPPAFAPNRKSVPQALGAYRRLAEAGARVTAPHGVLVAASCSAHVSLEEFMGAVEEGLSAARRSGRTLRIAGQPPDHPAPLTCPELRYLKVVFVQLAD